MRCSPLGCLAACLFTLLSVRPAVAEEDPFAGAKESETQSESGLELDMSIGYLLPVGRFEPGRRISQAATPFIPLSADIGYRINSHYFVGLHGLYGLGITSPTPQTDCPDCSHNLVRFGLVGTYRTPLTSVGTLFVGLGSGVQFLNTTIDQSLQKTRSISGWELLNVRAGTEWAVTRGFGLGTFVSAALGTFDSEHTECLSTKRVDGVGCATAERDTTEPLHGAGPHLWLGFGVRAVVLP